MNEIKVPPRQENSDPVDSQPGKNKSIVFEYTGNQNLKLKGVNSGKIYYFRFQGEKIKVDSEDSFALMAERNLKIHSY